MRARSPARTPAAGLHFPVHNEHVAVAFCGRDQRGLEGESVDFAGDSAALPHGPGFLEVDGDAGDYPSERGAGGFEGGFEGL